MFECESRPVRARRAQADVRRLVEEGSLHGLELAVLSATNVGYVGGMLAARPPGPGCVLVGVEGRGLFRVGRDGPKLAYRSTAIRDGDAVRWMIVELWRQGVARSQVLRLSGAIDVLAAALEDQIARRRRGEPPVAALDPAWTLAFEGVEPMRERAIESLVTLADGRLGTRGSLLVERGHGDPAVLMSGVYARGGAESHLLPAPRWNTIAFDGDAGASVRRVLDLHTGVLYQHLGSEDGLEAVLFCSLARPATAVLRARDRSGRMRTYRSLEPPSGAAQQAGHSEEGSWMQVRGAPGSIAAAAHDRISGTTSDRVLDRVAGYDGAPVGEAHRGAALGRVQRACRLGFDRLLVEHRRAWARRWEDADVLIEGDPELQLAVRLAIFHLLASAPHTGEAAVGARGLTGTAYRGHVFWDSDVYVLPFLAATHPKAARALLEYRVRRLPAAIRAARSQGREGARFPWESARSGRDVTPRSAHDRRGEIVPILTGKLEEHIVADVAWAAACYIDWTGDRVFAADPGRELIVQTARWWASRIELDERGHGHIRGVIGPDQYHERVDDNAFTNVMARWNLKHAAAIAAGSAAQPERRRWLELADTIVDGHDPTTGIYEQFAGFHTLEPLLIAHVAPQRPVSADVLMLHYLIPDDVAPGSLAPNLDFYEPRTAHGSSLSPGVHAALLARAGRLPDAVEMLRLTARIDLEDVGHMTAGGVHLAAMGSVWRTLTFGFAGLRPVGQALAIDPVLPPGWDALELRVRFCDSHVRVRVEPDGVEASADPSLHALSPAGEPVELTRAAQRFELAPRSPRRLS